jgi:pimeloyl-ACP methyl ester carboxylesterase
VAEPGHSPVYFLHDAEVIPGEVGALEALSTIVDVSVPRHPGFGVDDALTDSWDSVRDVAQYHLEKLRQRPGSGKVQLMGAGFGGWVALEMAVRARELFESLTLIAPFGVKFAGRLEPEFADILLLDPEELLELGWANPGNATGIRLPGYPEELTDADNERLFSDRSALARYGWKPFLHDPYLRRWISVIDVPTLVVCGSHDRIVAPQNSRQLAAELPHATVIEIADSGHYPYLETPDEFLDAVVPFLTRTESTGRIL